MEQFIAKVQELAPLYGMKILAALVIFIIGRYVAKGIRYFLRRVLEKSRVEQTLTAFTVNVTYVAVMTFVVIAALSKLGIQTASFIAVLGAAGLAVGLALQGSLSNFAAGVLMIVFKPFKVGDLIEAGGEMGVVEEIVIFVTEIRSPDYKAIIIPNAQVTGGSIINHTAKDIRRVDMVAGVSYNDDLDKVRSVLESLLSEDERILKDPAPMIVVLEMADSSVNFGVRPWVKTKDYWAVFFDTQEKIKKRFDREGITIPFPQRDVHMDQVA